jgi:hypothetical protein
MLLLVACTLLGGCAARKELATDDSGMPIPLVKMALVKIPLNGSTDNNLLDDAPPVERFTAEPMQVAQPPAW